MSPAARDPVGGNIDETGRRLADADDDAEALRDDSTVRPYRVDETNRTTKGHARSAGLARRKRLNQATGQRRLRSHETTGHHEKELAPLAPPRFLTL